MFKLQSAHSVTDVCTCAADKGRRLHWCLIRWKNCFRFLSLKIIGVKMKKLINSFTQKDFQRSLYIFWSGKGAKLITELLILLAWAHLQGITFNCDLFPHLFAVLKFADSVLSHGDKSTFLTQDISDTSFFFFPSTKANILFLFFILSISSPVWWRLWYRFWTRLTLKKKAASQQDNLHSRATGRAGKSFWEDTLPWHLYSGRTRTKSQTHGSSSSGMNLKAA